MRAFFCSGRSLVKAVDTDAIDIVTKRYIIRIRLGGILVIRKARPKKNLPEKVKLDKNLTLT